MRAICGWLLLAICTFATGCGAVNLPDGVAPSLQEVERVVNDSSLNGQEKRDALAALGLDALRINALLRAERTANQFGGTLRSAIDKVSASRFSQLTPDEVQLYGDAAAATGGPFTGTVSDDAAQAIVSLFANRAIDDADALDAFLDDPGNETPAGIPNDTLRPLFVDEDPDDVLSQLP